MKIFTIVKKNRSARAHQNTASLYMVCKKILPPARTHLMSQIVVNGALSDAAMHHIIYL